MSAVSAAQNTVDSDEILTNNYIDDNSISESIDSTDSLLDIKTDDSKDESEQLSYEKTSKLQLSNEDNNNSKLESKKNFYINIYNTDHIYGYEFYDIGITTPNTDTKNIKFYLDDEQIQVERSEYPISPIDFYISPKNLTLGTHTIKVVFKGDENYLPLTTSQTIKREAQILIDYSNRCFLNLPETANGNLALYINNELFSQVKLINGSGEIQFNNKPGVYNVTLKYDGEDYPVSDETRTLTINPKIIINGTQDCMNINVICHENSTAKIIIKNKNTNQTIIEAPLENGKAIINLENVKFENKFIIIYSSDEYNYTNTYKEYNWEPIFNEYYCIGPGSYIEFSLPKNTSGQFKIENYECIDYRDVYRVWNHTNLIEEINYTNGKGRINLPNISGGEFRFYITITDELYGDFNTFIYANVKPVISIPTEIYNEGVINFELYNANETLEIYIDGALYETKQVNNGKATIKLVGLSYGNHTLELLYNGTYSQDLEFFFRYYTPHPYYDDYHYYYYPTYRDYYDAYKYIQDIFYKGPVSIIADDTTIGTPAVINIKVDENVQNVVVTILNKTYALNSSENITLTNLELGKYNITVSYIENNTSYTFNRTFNVLPVNGTFSELEKLIKKTEVESTIKLTKNYINTGSEKEILISKSITIDGQGHILDANNTSRIFNLVSYYSDYHSPNIILKNIIFKNGNAKYGGAINANCEDYTIQNLKWSIINCTFMDCSADKGGALYGWGFNNIINSTFKHCSANKGGAIWSEDFLWTIINSTFTKCSAKQGGGIYFEETDNKILYCNFKENTANKYPNWYSKYNIITEITASDLKTIYTTNPYYTIKIYDNGGKLVNGAKVVVKLNGKTFKTLKTTKGVVKFQVTQTPGTYKLTITALKNTATKTLTVNHLVTLKTVKVKKSAKKLTLQANLAKVNGKYIKGKYVTFKFNGKTYKAKTNSKGVAKVTIKSNVLKKLRASKKITYQATYLKDIVKKTVKVQR